MTRLKELVLVAVASLAFIMITGVAKADAKKVIADITSAPGKLQNHIQMEIEKTKAYQSLLRLGLMPKQVWKWRRLRRLVLLL